MKRNNQYGFDNKTLAFHSKLLSTDLNNNNLLNNINHALNRDKMYNASVHETISENQKLSKKLNNVEISLEKEQTKSNYQNTDDENNLESSIEFLPEGFKYPVPLPSKSLQELLKRKAVNNQIIISFFDHSYINHFINFYYGSIIPLNITNFLPFVLDQKSYDELLTLGVESSILSTGSISITDETAFFGNKAFAQKVNMKTLSIIHCLYYGYKVLFTDVDIVFFKNPLFYMTDYYDMTVQMEYYTPFKEINSGFMYLRPTFNTLQCLYLSWDLYCGNIIRQQLVLNEAIFRLYPEHLSVRELDFSRFPTGRDFFDTEHINFLYQLPCKHCVIFHNNWIKGSSGKAYRMKEIGYYYKNIGNYYQNPSNKYITYTLNKNKGSREYQIDALKRMLYLAKSLGRILILPEFTCFETRNIVVRATKTREQQLSIHDHIVTDLSIDNINEKKQAQVYFSKYNYTSPFLNTSSYYDSKIIKPTNSLIFKTMNKKELQKNKYNDYRDPRLTIPQIIQFQAVLIPEDSSMDDTTSLNSLFSCGLNYFVCINNFDKLFKGLYREYISFRLLDYITIILIEIYIFLTYYSFRNNPLVLESVRTQIKNSKVITNVNIRKSNDTYIISFKLFNMNSFISLYTFFTLTSVYYISLDKNMSPTPIINYIKNNYENETVVSIDEPIFSIDDPIFESIFKKEIKLDDSGRQLKCY
ncbi:hypothetical protein WA158_005443 [Blastocystis sp. Blastoise]